MSQLNKLYDLDDTDIMEVNDRNATNWEQEHQLDGYHVIGCPLIYDAGSKWKRQTKQ